MCLYSSIAEYQLSKTELRNYQNGIGWKAFRPLKNFNSLAFFKNKFTFQNQSVNISYIRRRRWLKAINLRFLPCGPDGPDVIIYEDGSEKESYQEGFHIFLSYKGAVTWRESIYSNSLIKKVVFKDSTSLGYQKIHALTFKPFIFNCVVADQMLVL